MLKFTSLAAVLLLLLFSAGALAQQQQLQQPQTPSTGTLPAAQDQTEAVPASAPAPTSEVQRLAQTFIDNWNSQNLETMISESVLIHGPWGDNGILVGKKAFGDYQRRNKELFDAQKVDCRVTNVDEFRFKAIIVCNFHGLKFLGTGRVQDASLRTLVGFNQQGQVAKLFSVFDPPGVDALVVLPSQQRLVNLIYQVWEDSPELQKSVARNATVSFRGPLPKEVVAVLSLVDQSKFGPFVFEGRDIVLGAVGGFFSVTQLYMCPPQTVFADSSSIVQRFDLNTFERSLMLHARFADNGELTHLDFVFQGQE